MAALVLAGTEWGLIRLLWYLTPPQLPGKMQEYYGGLVHGYWLEVPERAVLAGAVLAILWSVVAAFRR